MRKYELPTSKPSKVIVWQTYIHTDRLTDTTEITGSTLALHCCKTHTNSSRKMENLTPVKKVTPENIILKLCIRNYVRKVTRHANFGFNRYSEGFSPNRQYITTLWLFLTVRSCTYLFLLDLTLRSNHWTNFHTWWLKRRFSEQGWSFWGLEQWVTIFGENMPPKLSKMGVNRPFQAKMAKYKNHHISKTINWIKTKFEDEAETGNCTSWVV